MTDQKSEREVICAHCLMPMRGSAGLTMHGLDYPLCHPDVGLDCYCLVTIYHHHMPCEPCSAISTVFPRESLNGHEILGAGRPRPPL